MAQSDGDEKAGELMSVEELTEEEKNELFESSWKRGDYVRACHWANRGADAQRVLADLEGQGDADPLCQAIERQDWTTARMLAFRVSELSAFDGASPLMLCAAWVDNPDALDVARRLLTLGAPLWPINDSGVDALSEAARRGNDAFAKMLLNEAKSRNDLSVPRLSLALRRGVILRVISPQMAFILLEAGADPDEKGAVDKRSARDLMDDLGEPRRSELLEALSAIEQRSQLGGQVALGPKPERSGPRL